MSVREAVPPDFKIEGSDLLAKLLYNRGIRSAAEAEAFLSPQYVPHDPYLMKGMKEAVELLLSAFEKEERLTIFSDYDADGIPGAVLMSDFFKKVGYSNFDVYIPDRHAEGFGLNDSAVRDIAARGTKLLITIDCGIADGNEIDLAKKLGMKVVITDHHTPTHGLPKAEAIIDPKQEGCGYPDKNLCGSGVAFKFVEAALSALRSDPLYAERFTLNPVPIGWEKWLLDMVGIATLSDMVPLTGENRMFARFGLAVLKKSPRPGLNSLFRALRLERRNLSEDDISFSISPRINAASRMGSPMDAFKLLSTADESEAMELARGLEKLNNERKGVVAGIIKEIKHIAKERQVSARKVIVMGKPDWRPALLGLAAGTVAEEYHRPVFLWGRDSETTLKGSCRGGGGVDILELMQNAGDIFLEFGGHAGAGGFSVALDRIHLLEDKLEAAIEKCLTGKAETASPEIFADHPLNISDLDWQILSDLERLAPFGVGNPKPVFLFDKVEIFEVRRFGKDNVHTALRFAKNDGEMIEAIAFFATPEKWTAPIEAGKKISLLAHIEQSNFRGSRELRLRIVDIFS